MLWCSAYQMRVYPSASARCASATLAAKLSAGVWPRPTKARSRIERGGEKAGSLMLKRLVGRPRNH